MTQTDQAAGGDAGGETTRTVTLGGETVRIERPTGLKATRALAILRQLSKATPELQAELAAFRRRYEAEHVLELDRVQAKLRYPPRPITELDEEGNERVLLDEAGQPRMYPSPVDRLTEKDWQEAGGVYRLPQSPTGVEVIVALFDRALELAEETVYRFLALFIIPNGDLKRYRAEGSLEERVAQRATELLDDAFADELLELAVVVAETVDGHFRRKADALGDRLGGILRLLGLDRAKTPPASRNPSGHSASRPNSSTDTPPSTDGDPTTPSTPPSTSSSSSATSPNGTPSSEPSPPMAEATAP